MAFGPYQQLGKPKWNKIKEGGRSQISHANLFWKGFKTNDAIFIFDIFKIYYDSITLIFN